MAFGVTMTLVWQSLIWWTKLVLLWILSYILLCFGNRFKQLRKFSLSANVSQTFSYDFFLNILFLTSSLLDYSLIYQKHLTL